MTSCMAGESTKGLSQPFREHECAILSRLGHYWIGSTEATYRDRETILWTQQIASKQPAIALHNSLTLRSRGKVYYGVNQIKNQGSPISPLPPLDSTQAASADTAPSSGQGCSPASLQNEATSRSNVSLEIHSGHEDADFYRQPNGASLCCGSSSQPHHTNQLQPSHMTQQPTTQGPIMLLNNGKHKHRRSMQVQRRVVRWHMCCIS